MVEAKETTEKETKEEDDWFGFWDFVFFTVTGVIVIVGIMSLIFLYFWTHIF